ncbi:MAG: hypothetical protein JWP16_1262 [Alphaproteobacteria bacterium]|nr:hypothetical protein [Alphaproteobacteria bacterium]
MRNLYGAAFLLAALQSASAQQRDIARQLLPDLQTKADMDTRAALKSTGPARAGDTIIDSRSAVQATDKTARNNAVAEISASGADGRATLKLGHAYTEALVPQIGDVISWGSQQTSWSFAISAPLDKSADQTDILTSDALPSDFQAKIGFSRFVSHFSLNARKMVSLHEAARKNCYDANGASTYYKPIAPGPPSVDHLVPACDGVNARKLEAEYLPDGQATLENQMRSLMYAYGGEAGIGYGKFDYFDAVSAAANHSTSIPWSVKAYAGILPSTDALLILASVEYRDSFKAGKTGTLCPLPAGATVLTCVTGAVGAPKDTKALALALEARREWAVESPVLNGLGMTALGIDPKFSYDVKNKEYGFQVPLSFVMDEKKNLVGGVSLGWTSSTHDIVAGIFFGSAFGFSPE